jgi:hypothetical protein
MEILISGSTIFIDSDDFEKFNKYSWHIFRREGKTSYARTDAIGADGHWHALYLHRLITDAKPGQYIDHKNRNGLDCRKSNLRFCSMRENALNQKIRTTNTSGYKGVTHSRNNKRWIAQTKLYGKRIYIGIFDTKEEAAKAYADYAFANFGEFARLS